VRHGSFVDPTGPPPPYESVITDAASHSFPGAASAAEPAAGGIMHKVPGFGQLAAGSGAAAASNGNAALQAGTDRAAASHFEIAVADPVKQGEGVSAFVSYKVCGHADSCLLTGCRGLVTSAMPGIQETVVKRRSWRCSRM
jgi:hypothetical protein